MTMMLASNQTIAGIRALALRDAMKKSLYLAFFKNDEKQAIDLGSLAAYLFGSRDADVVDIIAELVRLGYVEERFYKDEQSYVLTKTGLSFLSASGAPKIRRSTADRLIQELTQRVQHVNTSDDFIDRVTTLYVFGSYVTGAERLGDLDIYGITEPKDQDRERDASLRHADKSGRTFSNFSERAFWPTTQIYLYLRNRKRSMSIILDNYHRSMCPSEARLVELWPTDRRNDEIPGVEESDGD